ncbi:ABC transporter permease [Pedomonas mirosovicensis]|uniref:ABC transporter permease n=1 Tax=Pedomonas mirosovicensis TaxID=2908641 RepID=UPI002166C2C4|nr:ABC transporter permease [Pedomonas mirosovicensis]MCH8685055.1 ABC transporter permease [Pedomonas mirosovicensis]
MKLIPSLRLATLSLKAHKLRSALTMLGIIIGVASVITMVSIGQGARDKIDAEIRAMGTNLMIIFPSGGRGPVRSESSTIPMVEKDAEAMKRRISGVVAAAPVRFGQGQIVVGGSNWEATLLGTNNDFLIARNWAVAEGRDFRPLEERSASKVVLIGESVRKELFPKGGAIGATIRINRVPMKVVGILAPKGSGSGQRDEDNVTIVPLKTAQSRLMGSGDRIAGEIHAIFVKTSSQEIMTRVQAEIESLMRELKRTPAGADAPVRVGNLTEMMALRTQTTRTMTALLGAIASVALVVGGIGIMNIMLVSVTERTREIGLRMAVGARPEDILSQFLTESALLSLVGGLIGVAISLLLVFGISMLGAFDVTLNMQIVLVSLFFAGLVGIVFGYYPARKASRLNPIEALRYD